MPTPAARLSTLLVCLCVLVGCARAAIEGLSNTTDPAQGAGTDAGPDAGEGAGDGSNGKRDAGAIPARDAGGNTKVDSGLTVPKTDAGSPMPDAATALCSDPGSSCAMATAPSLGEIDASDAASQVTHQAKGSGWFAVDLKDGGKAAMSNTQIGVGVKLTAPSGATYSVTLLGDTSPSGAGRCASADVTDSDPLAKTAIWGSFGPTTAQKRELAVHVEHLSGPCDQPWTLTITGNPCPNLSFGFGEDSLGSCP